MLLDPPWILAHRAGVLWLFMLNMMIFTWYTGYFTLLNLDAFNSLKIATIRLMIMMENMP
jgi:hypothetical protein